MERGEAKSEPILGCTKNSLWFVVSLSLRQGNLIAKGGLRKYLCVCVRVRAGACPCVRVGVPACVGGLIIGAPRGSGSQSHGVRIVKCISFP